MNERYACYCGLYCGNCPVKARVYPAAERLYEEMIKAGFNEVVQLIPGGDGFWDFLKGMKESGICISCRDGDGNPGCEVRICAKEKGKEMCAFCEEYPCELFERYFEGYPILKKDNAFLREKGMGPWLKMQDGRRKKGYTYSDEEKKG